MSDSLFTLFRNRYRARRTPEPTGSQHPASDDPFLAACSGSFPPAGERIAGFLAEHPDGDLMVAVEYVSPTGFAWLHRHTTGRAVCLFIADTTARHQRKRWSRYFRLATEPEAHLPRDFRDCRDFLNRDDVQIHNWCYAVDDVDYEINGTHITVPAKQPNLKRLRCWIVHTNETPVAALAGLADLSSEGLASDTEVLVEATTGEHINHAWDTAQFNWRKTQSTRDFTAGHSHDEDHATRSKVEHG